MILLKVLQFKYFRVDLVEDELGLLEVQLVIDVKALDQVDQSLALRVRLDNQLFVALQNGKLV